MRSFLRRFLLEMSYLPCVLGLHKWRPNRSGMVGAPAYYCDRCGRMKGRVMM